MVEGRESRPWVLTPKALAAEAWKKSLSPSGLMVTSYPKRSAFFSIGLETKAQGEKVLKRRTTRLA